MSRDEWEHVFHSPSTSTATPRSLSASFPSPRGAGQPGSATVGSPYEMIARTNHQVEKFLNSSQRGGANSTFHRPPVVHWTVYGKPGSIAIKLSEQATSDETQPL